MLVCHCRVVTDRTIREAVRSGAHSVDAVAECCGASTGCGGCRELVECIVADETGTVARPLIQLRRGEPACEPSPASSG